MLKEEEFLIKQKQIAEKQSENNIIIVPHPHPSSLNLTFKSTRED